VHRWDQYGFDKTRFRTRYVKLVFLHPVVSACHVEHSGASGARKTTHYFSCSGGTGTDLTKSPSRHVMPNFYFFASGWIYRSHSAFRYVRGMKSRHTIFLASVGPVWVSRKALQDTLCRTCLFPSFGICGSRSAFWCVRGAKRRHTIFHARVGHVRNPQKLHWDTLRRTFVFASGGISGSRSAFWCFRRVNHCHNIFQAQLGPVWI
jgi:hypothetical protein